MGVAGGFALGYAGMAATKAAEPYRVRDYGVVLRGEQACALRIRERCSPPPIGAVVWPASQVLLHWALDGWFQRGGEATSSRGAVVLEIGSGTGLTAIGLALAAPAGCVRSVLATDACAESRANCEHNVQRNGAGGTVRAAAWDINDEPPCDLRDVTHVLAADVVYHGASGEQLVRRLVQMLEANPELEIALLLVDRFSGGSVGALSALAGVPSASSVASSIDPAIEAFERAASDAGLRLAYEPLGEVVARGMTDSLSWWERTRWLALGHWDAMRLYRVRR